MPILNVAILLQYRLTRISHKSESRGHVRVADTVFWTTGGPGKQGAVGKQGFFLNESRTCTVAGDSDAVEPRTYLSRGRRSG